MSDVIETTVLELEMFWGTYRYLWGLEGDAFVGDHEVIRFVRIDDGDWTLLREEGGIWYCAHPDRFEDADIPKH